MRPGGSGKRARNNRGHARRGGGNRNQSFDSNGPDVKVRGSAAQVAEKYVTLARDASSTGDRVAAENYLQHAEHYTRIVNAMNERAAEAIRERAERERLEDLEEEEAELEAAAPAAPEGNGKPSSGRRRKRAEVESDEDAGIDEASEAERSQPAA
jgi:predicted ATPase